MASKDVVTRRTVVAALAALPAVFIIDSPQEKRSAAHTTFVATFNPKPGQESVVEKILRDVTVPTRKEAGCLRYDLYRTSATAAAFVLFEIYRDEAAHQAHRATAHYKAFRAALADLLSSPSQALALEGLDVVP